MSTVLQIQSNGIVRVPVATCDRIKLEKGAQDIYLFTGAHLPVVGAKIRATGYDPLNPTKESVAKAKKDAKDARGIAKAVTLACGYGAGWRKIQKTLKLSGVRLTDSQTQEIHAGYWRLYEQVAQYSQALQEEWRESMPMGSGRRCGYVLNGFGLPMAVPEDKLKDTLNRVCQSTGHLALMKLIRIADEELRKAGIEYTPIVIDWHDETQIEVDEKDAKRVCELYETVIIRRLNEEIGGSIPLKIDGGIKRDMAEAKVEGYKRGD